MGLGILAAIFAITLSGPVELVVVPPVQVWPRVEVAELGPLRSLEDVFVDNAPRYYDQRLTRPDCGQPFFCKGERRAAVAERGVARPDNPMAALYFVVVGNVAGASKFGDGDDNLGAHIVGGRLTHIHKFNIARRLLVVSDTSEGADLHRDVSSKLPLCSVRCDFGCTKRRVGRLVGGDGGGLSVFEPAKGNDGYDELPECEQRQDDVGREALSLQIGFSGVLALLFGGFGLGLWGGYYFDVKRVAARSAVVVGLLLHGLGWLALLSGGL